MTEREKEGRKGGKEEVKHIRHMGDLLPWSLVDMWKGLGCLMMNNSAVLFYFYLYDSDVTSGTYHSTLHNVSYNALAKVN